MVCESVRMQGVCVRYMYVVYVSVRCVRMWYVRMQGVCVWCVRVRYVRICGV